MEAILFRIRLLFIHLFSAWNCATLSCLLVFFGAYLTVKLIKGMLRR